jgi:hypothetical protein
MEYLSTTSLANELDVPINELFNKLKSIGWIDRKADKWVLTELGREKGGQTRTNPKFGEYIVWPENISFDNGQNKEKPRLLNATAIGKHFGISPQRLNLILSELGWIGKNIAGWSVTKLGKSIGGKQFEADQGFTYVIWPDNILQNKSLTDVFIETYVDKETSKPLPSSEKTSNVSENFRDNYPANFRTLDGHRVRSKAEMIIDNLLYQYGIVHAYERKLPIEENVLSDFYLPGGKVYIEYWGMQNDLKYAERKRQKIEIYKKNEIPLIELTDTEIQNLDDFLPKKLLRYGIKVY